MKLATALKLAAKHGQVIEQTPNTGYVFRLEVNARNWIMVDGDGEKVTHVELLWESTNRKWYTTSYPTLARAICVAKDKRATFYHGTTKVVIQESYEGQAIRRALTVLIDGAELCGQPAQVAAMADDAVASGCPAQLLDWVEEHKVDSNQSVILL